MGSPRDVQIRRILCAQTLSISGGAKRRPLLHAVVGRLLRTVLIRHPRCKSSHGRSIGYVTNDSRK